MQLLRACGVFVFRCHGFLCFYADRVRIMDSRFHHMIVLCLASIAADQNDTYLKLASNRVGTFA